MKGNEMRIFVAFLIVLAAVYLWDTEYNNGTLSDGVRSMGRSISHIQQGFNLLLAYHKLLLLFAFFLPHIMLIGSTRHLPPSLAPRLQFSRPSSMSHRQDNGYDLGQASRDKIAADCLRPASPAPDWLRVR